MEFKIEKIKNKWVVFRVETVMGKTFKTKVAEYNKKSDAESHR